MLMFCIRPAELTTLRITDAGITGAVYGAVVHKADNTARTMTIAGECLRHDPHNFTSPVQNYVVQVDIEKSPFGSLKQGNYLIMDFYRKVKKYYKLFGNVEELHLKNHFICGLSHDNQLEAGICGLDLPLDELVARLSAMENLTNQDK
ncbi:hypothetical protein Glove_38g71 [Diversispora epigaea]|uniref:Uncharacterized protein n=1 Tax=Diversispora epigaea TaxID=1348612 RepID=A0A397JMN6_9GLOM|nr:hypothetical protein Glove_38g71 [Diversispora epigaea]